MVRTTHEVLNQPPPLEDYNLFLTDPVLGDGVRRHSGDWAIGTLTAFGGAAGSSQAFEWGRLANGYPPTLHTHDRFGNRIDQVEYHPAWHHLMEQAVANGLHSLPWEQHPNEGRHVVRAAMTYLAGQIEAGHWCPISMTASVIPALRHNEALAAEWEPRLTSRTYDPSFRPGGEKAGVLMGMAMTEKQGGSDVRANTTRAVPVAGGAEGEYRVTGHKWFCSAPMCDAFLILAQAPGGLSCFFLPRWTPDGEVNGLRIQRLKDKLGNRSNASSEVEYEDAYAVLVGEEGRGVTTIIEMVGGTRLDCLTGSASLMRQAVAQAAHHIAHREAFGKRLVEQPLMRNVIADLEIEVEAATILMLRVAAAFDRSERDEHEAQLKRILTPVGKYWVTKRCPVVVGEALECLGGAGYVEDSILPRLYREAPLNAIWEGSGNVIALDVLRAIRREPASVDALLSEMDAARGADARLDRAIDDLAGALVTLDDPEPDARRLVGRMARTVQAALLVRFGETAVADAFIATRLDNDWGAMLGTLPRGLRLEPLVERAVPAI